MEKGLLSTLSLTFPGTGSPVRPERRCTMTNDVLITPVGSEVPGVTRHRF